MSKCAKWADGRGKNRLWALWTFFPLSATSEWTELTDAFNFAFSGRENILDLQMCCFHITLARKLQLLGMRKHITDYCLLTGAQEAMLSTEVVQGFRVLWGSLQKQRPPNGLRQAASLYDSPWLHWGGVSPPAANPLLRLLKVRPWSDTIRMPLRFSCGEFWPPLLLGVIRSTNSCGESENLYFSPWIQGCCYIWQPN